MRESLCIKVDYFVVQLSMMMIIELELKQKKLNIDGHNDLVDDDIVVDDEDDDMKDIGDDDAVCNNDDNDVVL